MSVETSHEIARHWRLKDQRYRLEGSLCPHCGQKNFPARSVCPACQNKPWNIDSAYLVIVAKIKILTGQTNHGS